MIFGNLPKIINDLNATGAALKALSGVHNIGNLNLNTANILNYQNAIKGLTAEQAVYVLATKNATAAQIEEIMTTESGVMIKGTYTQADIQAALAKQGLTNSIVTLTAAQQAEIINEGIVTSEKLSEIAAVLGLQTAENGALVSKEALNVAMVKEQLASIGVVGAQQQQILSLLGLTAAQKGNLTATNLLAGAWNKLKIAITTHPIGALLVAGAAAIALTAKIKQSVDEAEQEANDAIKETHENAKTALNDSKNALQNTQSELQNLESQLSSVNEQITLLANQTSLSLIDKEEIDKLAVAKQLLLEQQSLLESTEKMQSKSIAGDAMALLNTVIESRQYSPYGNSFTQGSADYETTIGYYVDNLENMYNQYIDKLKTNNHTNTDILLQNMQLQKSGMYSMISELNSIISSFQYADGTIIEGYELVYDKYSDYLHNMQALADPENFYGLIDSFNISNVDIGSMYEEILRTAYQGKYDISQVNESFINALADKGISKETIDYIFKIKQEQFSDIVESVSEKYPELTNSSNFGDYLGKEMSLGAVATKWDTNKQIYSIDGTVNQQATNAFQSKAKSIQQQMNDYAEKNPVEFELLATFNEGFDSFDKYLDEEYAKVNDWTIAFNNAMSRVQLDIGDAQIADDKANTIRQRLLDYAEKNPVEFELLATYDDNFELLDQYIDEELKNTNNFETAVNNALNRITKEMRELNIDSGISFTVDIKTEKENIDKLNTAIKESTEATGLSSESIDNLISRYKNLSNFNASELFEKTASGVRLNTEALHDLEKQYVNIQKRKNDAWLQKLIKQYNNLQEEIKAETDAQERANLLAQRNSLYKQIQEAAELATMYDGLTSAYKRWQDAQNSGEEGDIYDSIREGYEGAKELYDKGLVGTEDFKTYVDILSAKDLSSASVEEIVSAWNNLSQTIQGTSYSVKDFLAEGDQGVRNFLNAVSQVNDEWASQDKNGNWKIDFGVGNDKEIADALGTTEEFVQNMLMKLNDYGFDIDIDSAYSKLELVQSEADAANQRLIELGKTSITFDFTGKDIDSVTSQIEKAEQMLEQFKDADGNIDLEIAGAKEAQGILATLIYQKQRLDEAAILKVDTSQADGGVAEVISKLQEFKTAYNELEVQTAVGADTTEAQSACDSLLTEIAGMDANILADLSIDTTSIDTLNATMNAITPEIMVKAGLDTSLIEGYQAAEHTTDGTVIWDNNISAVTAWANQNHTSSGTVKWSNDTTYVKTYFTATGKVIWGNGKVSGTAHSKGTAFAKGNWGTKNSGVALGGELGTELIVRDGKFFTIGDKSAEFFKYRKGDIIFNAEQTEQIFKYGKITSGNRRGNAYAEGTAFSSGSGKFYNSSSYSSSSSSGSSSGSSSSSKSSSSSSSSSKAEDFEEIFDWIEIAIDRIERAIDRLDLKVGSTYRSWESRNKNLKSEIGKVTEEISLQEKAYDRYMQEANSVGLNKSWAKKVRDGTIDIETITDEDLADKVQKYQDWYEQALACKDSIDELNESLGELYETAFNNKQTEWEQIIGIVDHESSMIEEFINQSEANGHVISTQYYQALIDREKTNIDNMTQERDDLLLKLKEGLENGAIEQGSETYYNMLASINEVTLGIEESNSEIKEFRNNIRDIEWEVFDLIQNKIANVTKEADFLIDLMDDSKLFDDKGQLTNTGLAVMGLHGQNYNVAMAQADQYAQEILNIDKQLAEDPYNQDLIERRQELLELQQDSILAAESEKLAIKDMVAEGIDLELEALSDLIDKYEESLDAQKNLYDYQKKIKEQTSEIASLQKQLTAYAGDTSEETKAKVQKLEISLAEAQEELQETQYDHFISDSKKMLDEIYVEYEEILNARLDDIDALLSDMIGVINDSSYSINQTLTDQTANVGYTLSQEMSNIWSSSNGVNGILTTYGDGFTTQLTSVNVTLSTINVNVQNMIEQLNKIAGTNINAAKDSNASNSEESKATKVEPPKPTPPPQPPQPEKTIEVGGKINAGNAKIYAYAGGSGSSQYFASDPIYTVLDEKNGYLLVRWHKLSSGQTGWFKKSDVKAYKTGVKNLDKNQLAWTQEDGLEAIIRPSDGAILTPLERKDTVLTNGETSNILSMANNPSGFIRDNLFDSSSTDSIKTHSINNKTEVNFDNIHLVLPNVKNYDEFLYALQHDNKFEKIVRAMTTDKIFGGSILKKYKY